MTFEERSGAFNQEILRLQKKYKVTLYAANTVLKNNDVAPMVRLGDMEQQEKAYENSPENGAGANKKASKNRS